MAKKKMKEKGISPLIATVLIIGFTVALASIILVWGTDFFKNITEKAECDSKIQTACTELDFAITNLTCDTTGQATITIDNRGNRQIERFTLRQHQAGGVTVNSSIKAGTNANEALGPFEVKSFEVSGLTAGEITKVEAIPEIRIEDCESKSCNQIIRDTTNGCIVT